MAVISEGPECPLVETVVDMAALTTRGVSFQRRYVCVACSLTFKKNEMQFYNGKPYGIPCGCSKDILRLMRKER